MAERKVFRLEVVVVPRVEVEVTVIRQQAIGSRQTPALLVLAAVDIDVLRIGNGRLKDEVVFCTPWPGGLS